MCAVNDHRTVHWVGVFLLGCHHLRPSRALYCCTIGRLCVILRLFRLEGSLFGKHKVFVLLFSNVTEDASACVSWSVILVLLFDVSTSIFIDQRQRERTTFDATPEILCSALFFCANLSRWTPFLPLTHTCVCIASLS